MKSIQSRIMNLEGLWNLEEEIEQLQVIRSLQERGIAIESVERTPIITEWNKQFDTLVSDEKKKATPDYSDQFLWHLFSFELLSAQREDAACRAFDAADKTELYLFFDYSEKAFRIKNAHLLRAEDVERLSEFTPMDYADMYFFDPVKKWTYVRTHEDYLGPYYFKAE